jgi:hypothetical protein
LSPWEGRSTYTTILKTVLAAIALRQDTLINSATVTFLKSPYSLSKFLNVLYPSGTFFRECSAMDLFRHALWKVRQSLVGAAERDIGTNRTIAGVAVALANLHQPWQSGPCILVLIELIINSGRLNIKGYAKDPGRIGRYIHPRNDLFDNIVLQLTIGESRLEILQNHVLVGFGHIRRNTQVF